jgi:hypothetical protein
MISACASGYLEGTPLLDLNYQEDSGPGPDCVVAHHGRLDNIVTLQVDNKVPIDTLEQVCQPFSAPGRPFPACLSACRLSHWAWPAMPSAASSLKSIASCPGPACVCSVVKGKALAVCAAGDRAGGGGVPGRGRLHARGARQARAAACPGAGPNEDVIAQASRRRILCEHRSEFVCPITSLCPHASPMPGMWTPRPPFLYHCLASGCCHQQRDLADGDRSRLAHPIRVQV